ncbi:MAG: hypothetical protein M3425_00735 [Actinomycetota bacterium]|nr:hypothetical protein [Actinomycetota bacterium]MDQ3528471.1 hypothetical protein [Actinomycetota bacterium]
MVDLTALSEPALARLRAKHEAREAALEASRRSIRASANAIPAAHHRRLPRRGHRRTAAPHRPGRAIIERTRGDLTSALVQARLRDALDAHRHEVLGG